MTKCTLYIKGQFIHFITRIYNLFNKHDGQDGTQVNSDGTV